MRPHQGRLEGEDDVPQPAGSILFNATQKTIDLLGHKGTQQPQVLSQGEVTSSTPLQTAKLALAGKNFC